MVLKREMKILTLIVSVVVIALPVDGLTEPLSLGDMAVIEAVLHHSIVGKLANCHRPNTVNPECPAAVLSKTIALCSVEPRSRMGCIRLTDLERYHLWFEEYFEADQIPVIVEAFGATNSRRFDLLPEILGGAVLVEPEDIDSGAHHDIGLGAGYAGFSMPGYLDDSTALVYASYFCGGLSAGGMLFLVEREAGSWRVISVRGMWKA